VGEPDVKRKLPVGRMVPPPALENLQRVLRVIRRLSQDQSAQKKRNFELRVEIRHDVQESVETVVVQPGHLPISRHLDRLQPGDVGQDIPEPEGVGRARADRGEQPRPLPPLPTGLRKRSPGEHPPGEPHGNQERQGGCPPPPAPRGVVHAFRNRSASGTRPPPIRRSFPESALRNPPRIRYSGGPRGARSSLYAHGKCQGAPKRPLVPSC